MNANLNFRPYRGDVKRDAETYLQYMEGFNTAVPTKNIEPLKILSILN